MRLFCYGTLMLPEVMQSIIGRSLRPRPAVLPGYRLYSIKRAVYPAVLPEKGAEVRGVVYRGLRLADIRRLDAFEGREYRRKACVINSAGRGLSAWVYVYREAYRARLGEAGWSLARFRRRHLHDYLRQ